MKEGNFPLDSTFQRHCMGRCDSAEKCKLVGSFHLSQLQDLIINVGLYIDNPLLTLKT